MANNDQADLKKRVDDLVDFLFDKEMSQEGFQSVSNWQEDHKNYDVLGFCEKIYDIFGYIGMSNEQIEKFIVKNLGIFLMPIEEIYKIAFVLKEVDLIDEIFESEYYSARITKYKRLFMRDFICKKSGSYDIGIGLAGLILGNTVAYGRYHMNIAANRALGVSVDSDEELEQTLNKILKFNGNDITVDEYITKQKNLFYSKYIRDKMNKGRKI